MHPDYLIGRFRKEMTMTVCEYIQTLKIEESVKLLAHSDHSICDIGAFLGFSSQSHFGSVFRKQMGMAPRKFRTKEQPRNQ